MGRRLKSQKRGKGSPKYKATLNSKVEVRYPSYSEKQKNEVAKGQLVEFINDPIRSGVTARVLFDDVEGKEVFLVAAEGMHLNQGVEFGKKAKMAIGNVLPLNEIAEGCPVFNIEKVPGDGGKLVKTSGSYGLLVTKDKKAMIKLPSNKLIGFNLDCRATIGNAAGSGRVEKPFIKAGNKHHAMKAKGKPYPSVRGVAMNPVDHPFGGGAHHAGKSKSTARGSPPGRMVGNIASRRTGRKKK
ncbi:MAG: 50S ribosomal protein L2 [archaeon]